MEALTLRERERRALLTNLNTAERALRQNLHQHGLDPTVRDHLEHALSHVREGYIAVNEPGRARTVGQVIEDITKAGNLLSRLLQQRQQHGTHSIGD